MISIDLKPMKLDSENPMDNNISLKEAVQHLIEKDDSLARLIEPARVRQANGSEQSAAVTLYSMEWGERPLCMLLHEAFKSGRQDKIDPWLPYLQLFRAGVENLSRHKGKCWCGTDANSEKHFRKGQTITWHGITSCSKSRDFILNQCVGKSGTLIQINVIHGVDTVSVTTEPVAEEVILMPGTMLRVKDLRCASTNKNVVVVELEELSERNNDERAPAVSKSQASTSNKQSSK